MRDSKRERTRVKSDGKSVEVESNFNSLSHRRRVAVRAGGRTEPPGANRFDRFLVETQAQAFYYVNVGGFAVGGNDGDQRNRALILCLYRFVRILRLRTVHASRITVAAGSRVKYATAGPAAGPYWWAAQRTHFSGPGPLQGSPIRIIRLFAQTRL